jgi:tetrahydromethanopterin S-methyltransferase subunit B
MAGSKKLIDILDEMNLKEDDVNNMVVGKLNKLVSIIFEVDDYSEDVQFVSTIIEDLISSPHHRITKLEIEKCNNLYKQYKEQVK